MRRVALIAITGGALAGCGGGGAPAAPDAGRDAAPPPTVDAPAPVADANAEPDAAPPDDVLLARTPPMGWNSWNHFHCDVSERLVRETADALVASGLADAGYRNVVIDDCWQVARDAGGTIVADRDRFPSGIAALADYVHGKGLKLGIYTDAGPQTCQNRPGSLGHERDDAATYAAWGVDYVKVDWCHNEGLDPRTQYAVVRDALAAAGRPIVFSICNWGVDSPWIWGPETGQLWRTTGDIEDSWQSMTGIAALTALHPAAARPGAWNDPDMLEVGNGGMTDDEYRVHFSLWAILAAPLMAGNDVRAMSPATLEILGNREVIAVDQDRLGLQGVLVRDSGGLQVWVKPLADPGARAVALVNRTGAAASISASWSDLGLAPGAATVRDLWAHTDRGSAVGSTAAMVPSHGVAMLRIVGAEPTPPAGTSYLSDWTWTHAVNGWAPPSATAATPRWAPATARRSRSAAPCTPRGSAPTPRRSCASTSAAAAAASPPTSASTTRPATTARWCSRSAPTARRSSPAGSSPAPPRPSRSTSTSAARAASSWRSGPPATTTTTITPTGGTRASCASDGRCRRRPDSVDSRPCGAR